MRGGLALILLAAAVPFLGVSCSKTGGVNQATDRLGNFFQQNIAKPLSEQIKRAQDRTLNFAGGTSESFIKDLTDKEKAAVEEWLTKNKLNQFGDKKDTVYTGGTPLFNEQTSESFNRFEYLFNKFPELKDIIKNAVTSKAVEKNKGA